jgi:anti-sigma regulatory factor (Ser/Thr protein kinase)
MSRHSVDDDLADVARAISWAEALASDAGLSDDLKFAIEICLEESLSNLIVHGRACDGGKQIAVSFVAEAGAVTIEVADQCEPFDVTRVALPAAPSAQDMHDGGQGLRLLNAFATALSYKSIDGRNTLTITLRPPPG